MMARDFFPQELIINSPSTWFITATDHFIWWTELKSLCKWFFEMHCYSLSKCEACSIRNWLPCSHCLSSSSSNVCGWDLPDERMSLALWELDEEGECWNENVQMSCRKYFLSYFFALIKRCIPDLRYCGFIAYLKYLLYAIKMRLN